MANALLALARMTGDSAMSAMDLREVLDAALGRRRDEDDDADDRAARPH